MPDQIPSYRTLYILVYPSRPFAAHWSLFLPYASSRGAKLGKRIHATGDRLNGFHLEIVRHYERGADSRTPGLYPIGRVPSSLVRDDDHSEGTEEQVDCTPRDDFEKSCVAVEAPGPSMNRVGEGGGQTNKGPPKKAVVKDCQWWVRECMQILYERGILLAEEEGGETPLKAVGNVPKH